MTATAPANRHTLEQRALAAMLVGRDTFTPTTELINEHAFTTPTHRTIFNTMIDLYAEDQPVDAITVADRLNQGRQLTDIGGAPYLHQLLAALPDGEPVSTRHAFDLVRADHPHGWSRFLDRTINPDHTPLNWLTDHLHGATAFYALVGYLDRSGFNLIHDPLTELLERGGQVHLVVDSRGDRPYRTDLAGLLDLFAPYGDLATITLVRDPMMLHSKVFTVHRGCGVRWALVGSANLTGAGLSRNWESCVEIGPDNTGVLDDIDTTITKWREHPAATRVDLGVLASLTPPGPTGVSAAIDAMLQPVLDKIEAAGADGGTMIGIPTGFSDLDRLINGLHPGELVIVAGRPGLGKSTLAMDFLRNASIRHDVPSLMLSFEMPRVDLMQRLLSAEARVPLHVLRSGQLSDDDWTKLARRMGDIQEAPLFINDTCSPSIRHVADEARRAVAEDGVKLVVVDYVQQLRVDRRTDSRQHEMAEISRSLKHLARELQVPVVVVSQLNRGPEQRTDKRPMLSDLRDSGAIEQDADVVILLHREDYYDKESPRAGEADFIVAKHRNGPTDTVTVAAQLHLSRFVDMAL